MWINRVISRKALPSNSSNPLRNRPTGVLRLGQIEIGIRPGSKSMVYTGDSPLLDGHSRRRQPPRILFAFIAQHIVLRRDNKRRRKIAEFRGSQRRSKFPPALTPATKTRPVAESGGMIISTSNLPTAEFRKKYPDWFYWRLVESNVDGQIRHIDLFKRDGKAKRRPVAADA
jgi:hypothetical protein